MNPPLVKYFSYHLHKKSSGSAITEFLIFTMPFFVILLVITLNVYQNSMANNEARNLARQSLRAFISSPSNELAEVRANQVLEIYRDSLSAQNASTRRFNIKFNCTKNPCLSAGGAVSAILEVSIAGNPSRRIISTATEYVDLWR
jgi:hypothetical protein